MAKAKQQVKGSKPSYMTTYEAADFLGFAAGGKHCKEDRAGQTKR